MTPQDIERMWSAAIVEAAQTQQPDVQVFARAVAAAARREALEEAAQIVLKEPMGMTNHPERCAAAIRARAGETA